MSIDARWSELKAFAATVICAVLLTTPLVGTAGGDGEIHATSLDQASFDMAHDAVVEAIQNEGLTLGNVAPFGQMMARSAAQLGHDRLPYQRAEVLQFCSAVLAWQLSAEDLSQISLCPMAVAVYEPNQDGAKVVLSYRSPGRASPGRAAMDDLLSRIVAHASAAAAAR